MLNNAVLSAKNMNWRDSMAFSEELEVPLDYLSIYQLNSAAALGDHKVDELQELVTSRIDDSGRSAGWKQSLRLSENRLKDIRVNDAERSVLQIGARRISDGNKQTLMALEKTFAENGYGVPAIAVLILLVVVVVAVIQQK